MPSRLLHLLWLALLLAAAPPQPDEARRLHATVPTQVPAAPAPTGQFRAATALAYVPASLRPGVPAPLLVLLHGSDSRAGDILPTFIPAAERHGMVVLAPECVDDNWDMIVSMRRQSRRARPSAHFGPDIKRMDAALAALFARVAIDPRRIALAGFSDGASYALAVGPANPQLFRTVIAFSPGFALFPEDGAGTVPIFLAHGRQDRTLPFARTEQLAAFLAANGVPHRFYPFDGDHVLKAPAMRAAMDYFLGDQR